MMVSSSALHDDAIIGTATLSSAWRRRWYDVDVLDGDIVGMTYEICGAVISVCSKKLHSGHFVFMLKGIVGC